MKQPEHSTPEQLDLFCPRPESPLTHADGQGECAAVSEIRSQTTLHQPSSAFETLLHREKATPKALAEALHHELEVATGCTIALVITNNTSNMMSVVLDAGGQIVKLRLHHMFLDAPRDVRHALAHWIRHPRSRKHAECFRNFIASRNHQVRRSAAARVNVRTSGRVFDLRAIFDALHADYFNTSLDAAITWGRETAAPMRSIRFGSYYEATKLIRIHPRLDQAFVPAYVVRYIVYHEMLHAHLGVCRNENGRRQIHSRRFKEIEKAYPEYQRAVDWIEDTANLNRLLKRGRSKKLS